MPQEKTVQATAEGAFGLLGDFYDLLGLPVSEECLRNTSPMLEDAMRGPLPVIPWEDGKDIRTDGMTDQ